MLARLGAHGTGDAAGALAEAWVLHGPMSELVALHGAGSPEELQRILVIPGRRTDTLPDEACWAFGRAHGEDGTGLVESVVLAVTNHRWQKVARRLLERLGEDGVLDGGHATVLSAAFLETDIVPVTVPGSWLVQFYVQQQARATGASIRRRPSRWSGTSPRRCGAGRPRVTRRRGRESLACCAVRCAWTAATAPLRSSG